MATLRSPPQTRRSARNTPTDKLAGDAASSLFSESQGRVDRDGRGVVLDAKTSQEATAGPGRDDKRIHKLDDNVYKPWGARSRSSSDAGSDTAFCNGGPGKEVCGEPVRHSDLGVQCEKCDLWFHTSCQLIPKTAYDALGQFDTIFSWLCPDCKKSLKAKVQDVSTSSPKLSVIESKVDLLEKSLREHMDHVSQSIKEQQCALENQTRAMERSLGEITSQKSSYADIVKGSCSDVVERVTAKLSAFPPLGETKNMTGIVKVFDDFIDKDRRKNNLVVHNLKEASGETKEERSKGDITLFCEMIKDSMKMNVSVSRAFRVGRVADRDRLLIVTLETPGVKQDILRMAPQLRNSDKWGNIYITPDLTPAEREAAKKLREELQARRRAGETNLTIRKGKVVVVGSAPAVKTSSAPVAPPVREDAVEAQSQRPRSVAQPARVQGPPTQAPPVGPASQ